MKKMHFWVATALAAVAAASANAADYRAEAEQLAKEIVDVHPRGSEIAQDPDFIAAREALIAMAGDADLPEYVMALGRMFHAAKDGHTGVLPVYSDLPEFSHRYPLRLKRFEDGLYVVAAKGAASPLLGKRLTAIGGRNANEILRDFVSAQAGGNRAWPANWTAVGLTIPGFLMGLGVASDAMTAPLSFEVAEASGRGRSAALLPSADGRENLKEISRKSLPLEMADGAPLNHVVDMKTKKALVFVIGAMENEEGRSFETFTREAIDALAATKARRLIIDLRDNGGGNNMLAEPLRRMIVRSRFNQPGGIYVLTSPQTFSAAQNFATRLERETDALFVGEPTGGAPNHFGDAKFASAPQSKLPYIISRLRWQDMPPFDKRPWILPDIPAPPSFDDYVAGRDAALEAALAHQPDAEMVDKWWRRAMEPWSRASQEGDWRFFFEN